MSVTIDLTPELESRLRAEAKKHGLDPDAYVVKKLCESLGQVEGRNSHLSRSESELLQTVNAGLDESTWKTYKELVSKRRAETLTPDEHEKLIEISNQIELQNAERLDCLIELARLRNVTLTGMMQQLGIETPAYE